jgi:hypothetical protein
VNCKATITAKTQSSPRLAKQLQQQQHHRRGAEPRRTTKEDVFLVNVAADIRHGKKGLNNAREWSFLTECDGGYSAWKQRPEQAKRMVLFE